MNTKEVAKNGNGKAAPGAQPQVKKEVEKLAPSGSTVNENGQLNQNGEVPKEDPALSVEDKIKKLNSLNSLAETRELIISHLNRVEALKFGDYDEKDTITLKKNGNAYEIKSTMLCTKIKALVIDELNAKKAEVEAKIQF